MTDQELRALVREAVARHLGRGAPGGERVEQPGAPSALPSHPRSAHPSQHLYLTIVNAGDACVIEPAVTCDHCGYCRSHGH